MAPVSIYSSSQIYTHQPSAGITVKDWLTPSPRNSPANVLKDSGNIGTTDTAGQKKTVPLSQARHVNAPQEEAPEPWTNRSLAHQFVNARLAETLEMVKRRTQAATIIQRAFLGKTGKNQANSSITESKDEKLIRLERELKLSTATNLKVRKEMEVWLKDRDSMSTTMEARKIKELEKKLDEKDRELERVEKKNRTQSRQLDKVLKDNGELRGQLGLVERV